MRTCLPLPVSEALRVLHSEVACVGTSKESTPIQRLRIKAATIEAGGSLGFEIDSNTGITFVQVLASFAAFRRGGLGISLPADGYSSVYTAAGTELPPGESPPGSRDSPDRRFFNGGLGLPSLAQA